MTSSSDVAVLDAGIVGALLAYHTVRGGARTLLVDRGETGHAEAFRLERPGLEASRQPPC